MPVLVGVLGVALIFLVLWDSFETIILPRRVTRRGRITALFYRFTWPPFASVVRRIRRPKRREALLGYYGPLSTLVLLSVWALGLLLAFGMLQYSAGSLLRAPEARPDFWTDLYMSGTTFFTLGLGDVIPRSSIARALAVTEAGLGFGFLALVIGYLPVLYQSFSRREVNISLLDARAGSPSTACELLSRYAREDGAAGLERFLHDWEHWTADMMESHISYPVLSFFRSQHDNQSWLGAVTTVLDACALLAAGVKDGPGWQAGLTFAIARHAVVDISQVLQRKPEPPHLDRLGADELERLREQLAAAGVELDTSRASLRVLSELRGLYEPYVWTLSRFLAMPLPLFVAHDRVAHNWRTTAWSRAGRARAASAGEPDDDHLGR
jgi:hypothetical protein